ncbi:unnamed protein product [Arabidopsis halleri]
MVDLVSDESLWLLEVSVPLVLLGLWWCWPLSGGLLLSLVSPMVALGVVFVVCVDGLIVASGLLLVVLRLYNRLFR